MLLGFLSFACGLILDTVTHGRRELKRLHYLSIPALAQTTGFAAVEDFPDVKRKIS
jgi:hypothetical protein